MNKIQGNITTVEVSGNLTLVHVAVTPSLVIKAIVIDTPETATYLEVNQKVTLLFKETEVILGVGNQKQLSLQNQIPGVVSTVESGKLLSKLRIQTDVGLITSIVSAAAVMHLNLQEGSKVYAMIKLNEVMLRAL